MARRASSPVLVGRVAELRQLERALDRAAAGETTVVLVAGEAGVGKTRLLNEFAVVARAAGARVAAGGCTALGDTLPYGPVVAALRSLARSLDAEELATVGQTVPSELSELVRELQSARDADAPERRPAASQGLLFAGVLHTLEIAASSSPLVLVVEDLHWADRSTRELLLYVVHATTDVPLLLVATYRTDGLPRGHPLRGDVAELVRSASVEALELGPLDHGDVSRLVAALLGREPSRALLETVAQLSEGNPFFVEELVMSLPSGGAVVSPMLRNILLARIEELSPAVQGVLRTLAVAGGRMNHRLLGVVCGLGEADLDEALREAVTRHLVVPDVASQSYAFRHALLAEAVYDDTLPGERVRLHAGIAHALTARPELGSDGAAVAPAELAHHWHHAGDATRALRASVEAGRAAARVFAHSEASAHFRRALELWPSVRDAAAIVETDRVDLLQAAADASYLAWEIERAISLTRDALELVDPDADPLRHSLLLDRFGRNLWMAGRTAEALDAYQEAGDRVANEPPGPEHARVLAGLARVCLLASYAHTSRKLARTAIAMARECGARAVEGQAMNTLAVTEADTGDVDEAIRLMLEARRIAEEVGEPEETCRTWVNLAYILFRAGRTEESISVSREGMGVAHRLGLDLRHPYLVANAVEACARLGRWSEAHDLIELGLDQASRGTTAMGLLSHRALIEALGGELDRARDTVARAHEMSLGAEDLQFRIPLLRAEVELALAESDPGRARGRVAQVEPLLAADEANIWRPAVTWLRLRAEADALNARLDERRDLDASDDLPVGTSAEAFLARAERARLNACEEGDAWQEAVAACDVHGDVFLRAYARWRLGKALLAEGRREEASEALRLGHRLLHDLPGAPVRREIEMLARYARVPLTVHPAPPAPAALSPFDGLGLTRREEEVLDLVADGRSNREIAEALYISVKTASVHVSNIMRKLGVSNRLEARALARRVRHTATL